MDATRTEASVKKACQQWLSAHGIEWHRMNSGMAMMPGRGGKPMPVRFGTPGMADILVILPPFGRALWLEIKRPLGPRGGDSHSKPTDDQVAFADKQSELGAGYRVVRSLEDLAQAVKEERDTVATICAYGWKVGEA